MKWFEKIVVLLLFLGCCCSRVTDQTSVKETQLEEKVDDQSKATSEGGSKAEEHHGEVTTTETEAWDQLVFVDDVPDGGPSVLEKKVVQVLVHHPATKVTVEAPWTREENSWLKTAFDGDKQTDLTGREKDQEEKKSRWDFMGSPLKWIGGGVLAAALLYALYRFRKSIPGLRLLPF